MPKNSWTDYSTTAASNTDVHSVSIAEGMAPSDVNNAMRELMVDVANFDQGNVTLTSALAIASGGTGATSAGAALTALGGVPLAGGTMTGNLALNSGIGINFAATADATGMTSELLDDYEEGVYNPALTCSTSGTYGMDSGYDSLSYTKIGRLVHVTGALNINSESSPNGQLRMSLPFTPYNLGEYSTSFYSNSFVFSDNSDADTDANIIGWTIFDVAYVAFYQQTHGTGAVGSLDNNDLDAAWSLHVSLQYIAN